MTEVHRFSGEIRDTGGSLYFVGEVSFQICGAIGPVDESWLVDGDETLLVNSNEAYAERTDPWEMAGGSAHVVRDDATMTVIRTGGDAAEKFSEFGEGENGLYLLGEFKAFPAYAPFYIEHNTNVYAVEQAMVHDSFSDDLLDVDAEESTLVRNVESGITKPVSMDRLHDLRDRGDLRAALRIRE